MSDERKRIYELDSAETIASNDSMVIDNPNREEAVKIPVNSFKTMLTKAEYDALPSSKNTDGIIYYITDSNKIMLNGNSYGGGEIVELTQAQYDALPSSKLTDGILYCITDATASASDVPYDNTESGLEAEEVQSAIDELQDTKANSDDLAPVATSGSYNDLDDKPTFNAEAISYDNTASGLEAENVQDAIDETITKLSAVGSASGAIATFSDGANLPMPKLEVGIEPQQDLHGYDAPWVGGAGKNKQMTPIVENVAYRNGGNLFTLAFNNGVITFTITSNASTFFDIKAFEIKSEHVGKTYTMSYISSPSLDDNNCIFETWDGTTRVSLESKTVTITNDLVGKWLCCRYYKYGAGTYTISNCQVEEGTTASAYAPYSNICPISGWDEVNVTVADDITNKSFFDGLMNGTYGVVDLGSLTWGHTSSNRSISNAIANIIKKPATQTSLANLLTSNGYTEVPSNTTLDTNGQFAISQSGEMIFYYDGVNEPKGYMVYELATPTTPTVTPSEINELYEEFGINGQTYTIDLNGTRYGGKVDLVSGVMTVDRVYKDLGDYNWTADSVTGLFRTQDNTIKLMGDIISSQYKGVKNLPVENMPDGSIQATNSQSLVLLRVRDFRFDGKTATEVKTMLTGVQMVAELATPLTIQLPTTVVKSLGGKNNVSADSGDVLDAKYVRDLTAIIDYILSQLEG